MKLETVDGNEAAAKVAYALSEIVALYPITPSSTMGEVCDAWAAAGKPNLFGQVPRIMEMQSEAGAAGVLHGAVMSGALATTFTSSQGLLLMIPELYKLAGEQLPAVLHIAARAIATHALSIFGDHSDVMAVRGTGVGLLCSNSVQEAHDMALVAHAATLETRLPFLHFFDGFRTSHEVQTIEPLPESAYRALIDVSLISAHRQRGLSPDRPNVRGTAQNPDVFFQSREAGNPLYLKVPAAVSRLLDKLAEATGRRYGLVEYCGHAQAERVIVMMGSGTQSAESAVSALVAKGEKVGLLKVRLYRPFPIEQFVALLPKTTKTIAVLDRCKEPGSTGEPLLLDVLAALAEAEAAGSSRPAKMPSVIGGRYGLSSKEFTPAMAAAVLAEAAKPAPKRRFTVGIKDDVTNLSLEWDAAFDTEDEGTTRAVFYGLGADGTVGANKEAIKLISNKTGRHGQAYFVYDSKKSGSMTVSHLRFGATPIKAPYLIERAQFVACHHPSLWRRADILATAAPGATLLLNADPETAWETLPTSAREQIRAKKLKVYAIDAFAIARKAKLGGRVNTVMQACFFSLTGTLPGWRAELEEVAKKAYGRKGDAVVARNIEAIAAAEGNLKEVAIPAKDACAVDYEHHLPESASAFMQKVVGPILANQGEGLPVSAMPTDGVYPSGTSQYEKRGIATEIPVWEEKLCTECNKCVLICPHAAIRAKAYQGETAGLPSIPWKGSGFPAGSRYTVQVSPDDCTGCKLCVEICPVEKEGKRAVNMAPMPEVHDREAARWDSFLKLPDAEPGALVGPQTRSTQMIRPLFEFSGACSGCGETPYVKLISQLFGSRLMVANATGCSSIYGGNLPTTPWTTDANGRGPAWANSLFEDNAEFGLGFRLAARSRQDRAKQLLAGLAPKLGELAGAILAGTSDTEIGATEQRKRVDALKEKLGSLPDAEAKELVDLADDLVDKSVWIVGGDGWAYDIGFGGLDHVLRTGEKVKILVLDTEVYSNTGGQASKATPRGAIARFAANGKRGARKDMALYAMGIRDVYVARVAIGANDTQAIRAMLEAESYPGPAIVIAYSPCIAHGISMDKHLDQQKLAVGSGYWPLLRFDPRRVEKGLSALQLDSKPAVNTFEDYIAHEGRYRALEASDPEAAAMLREAAKKDIEANWKELQRLAA